MPVMCPVPMCFDDNDIINNYVSVLSLSIISSHLLPSQIASCEHDTDSTYSDSFESTTLQTQHETS